MSYRFHGRERVTIEIDGWCDPAAVRIPSRLALELDGGRARVSLFAFHVDGLRVAGVPLLRWSYAEVVWRIAVTDGWWVPACDIAARGPRFAAARYVRYPVRALPVVVDDARVIDGGLAIELGELGEPATTETRPLLVGPAAEWRVPWGDDGNGARIAPVTRLTDADSLGAATLGAPVEWAGTARVRHGRQHRCGVAEPSA